MAKARGEVAIRLRPEGGADVTRAYKEVETAGVGAATRTKTATEAATAATDRQVQKLREMSTQQALVARAQADVQARAERNAGLGVGAGRSAAESGRVLFAEDAAAERRAAQLRALIDPLAAAQSRHNDEVREYDRLLARQKISEAEAIQLKARSKAALDAETAALQRNTNGLTRRQMAGRLNLTRQGADVFTTAAMGMNPAMIAIQQGPQILEAMSEAGIKARGSVIALGGAVGALAGAIGIMGAAWHDAEGQSLAVERAVTGLGRASGISAVELEVLAVAMADQAKVSVRSAREQAAAYVSTGRIGTQVIGDLIKVGKDYAATYGLDAEQATADLAQRMRDPAKAARDWTRELGLLDQKTIEHIESLQKQGDLTGAQTLLVRELTGALSGQAAKIGEIEGAWDAATRAVQNYWEAFNQAIFETRDEKIRRLDREIAAIDAGQLPAQGNRAIRGAGQTGGLRAELWVERTRLGVERLADEVGRADAKENRDAQDAWDRAHSGRSRSGSGRSTEAEAERARREALSRQRREEDRAAALKMTSAIAFQDFDLVRELEREETVRRRIRELIDDDVGAGVARLIASREQIKLDAAQAEIFARNLAQQERRHQIFVDELNGDFRFAEAARDRETREARIVELRKEGLDLATATALADSQLADERGARDAARERDWRTSMADREIDLARMRGNEPLARALELNRETEQLARRIERELGLNFGEGEDRARTYMADAAQAQAEGAARDWAQGFARSIRTSGIREALSDQLDRAADRFIERMVDGLFDMNWSGALGGQGGGNWLTSAASFLFGGVGRNADGTDWWPGGLTMVGERGRELVNLPRGSQVIDADRTRRLMLNGPSAAAPQVNHYHFSGNLMTPEFWEEIHRRDRRAAAAGAGQGASTAISVVQSSAGQVQHEERMLKS